MPHFQHPDGTHFDILCEDGPVLAVNKPAGVISQGAPKGVLSLSDYVKEYLRIKYEKPGNVYLGVIHRLDRPVTGVSLFSRNSKCAARLSEQFRLREVSKHYLALVESTQLPIEGRLEHWLRKIPDQPRGEVVAQSHSQAKFASLRYQTLMQHQGRTLVWVTLETGRMHQVRLQFSAIGAPLAGDTMYGGKRGGGHSRDEELAIALHAARLSLWHPVRYEPISVDAPIPATWKQWGLQKNRVNELMPAPEPPPARKSPKK